jgi:pimeloyl-ACP methyl ester carboxylesterase
MGFGDLVVDYGNGKIDKAVKPVDALEIVTTLFKSVAVGFYYWDLDRALKVLTDYVAGVFAGVECDQNGDPIYEAAIARFPLAASNYEELLGEGEGLCEMNIVKGAIDRFGADYTYYFAYDWRVDPLENADGIAAMVDQALADSGKDKVNLVCASMGGINTLAYMTKYGYEKLNNVVFVSSTIYGSYIASDVLSGDISLDPETVYQVLAFEVRDSKAGSLALKTVHKLGGFKALIGAANGLVNFLKDKIYEDVLKATLGYAPSYWALILPESYEDAVNYIFGDKLEENAAFIQRTGRLQAMVRNRDDMLRRAVEDGVGISLISGYNKAPIPIGKRGCSHGDGTLDSALMAGGAKVANFGFDLGDDYTPQRAECLSLDRIVDTSGCLFPDYTWMIKDGPHVGCRPGSEYAEFMFTLATYDGQPTVNTFPQYPRFMQTNTAQELFALE